MQIRTFSALNVVLLMGCGGNDYSEYFLPTGAARNAAASSTGAAGSPEHGQGGNGGVHTGGAGGSMEVGGRAGSTAGGGPAVDAGAWGCRAVAPWVLGQDYKAGATVSGLCLNPGGGSTVCEVGKTYVWTCKDGAPCSVYGPGGDGWWGVWTLGMSCD